MDLNSLQLFVNVVQTGSFSAASRKTLVPVATVSRRVAELEKELGVRLLERSTRRQRLTESGALLFEYAVRGLEEVAKGELALNHRQQHPRGTLRLSLPPNFEIWWQIIRRFQGAYPKVDVRILVTHRRIDMILDGIDVVLRVGEVGEESAVARKLTTYRHLLVASPAFLKKHGTPHQPSQLTSFPCAGWFTDEVPLTWKLGANVVTVAAFLRCNDYGQLMNLAIEGDCITELPPFLLKKCLASGQLVPVLPGFPFPEVPLYLAYPSRAHLSSLIRVFVDFCLALDWGEFLPGQD